MLTVNSISAEKNQQIIFKNLGFSIGLGSSLLICGENGSGKTTLLRSIAGLSQVVSGNILWNGDNVNNFIQEFNSDINYIGHKNFLKAKLTVLQNMEFYAGICGSEILIPSAIKYFGLEEVLNRPLYQLSSGWQKKVMLSKLIYQPKTLWLLDEPTINLDKNASNLLFELIETRVEEGGIVIIATHDEKLLNLINKSGGRIILEDFK
ncbi:MAG: heme exporter protein A [Lentimonas sp.]|jgi:heme exporter protein A